MVGIIGCGYWGKNYLRLFREFSVDHKTCDHHEGYDYQDYRELLENKEIEAVVIATPAETHCEIVKEALLREKHVLVEKPFALNAKEAEVLLSLKPKKILMVGHITCYDPCVERVRASLPELGKIRYASLQRIGRYPHHSYTDIISDLTCHDVATLTYLGIQGDIYNAYEVPMKRTLRIEGEKGFLTTDYQRVYLNDQLVFNRGPAEQPLLKEFLSFMNAIETGLLPCTDRQFGFTVVKACDRIRKQADLDPHKYVSYRMADAFVEGLRDG